MPEGYGSQEFWASILRKEDEMLCSTEVQSNMLGKYEQEMQPKTASEWAQAYMKFRDAARRTVLSSSGVPEAELDAVVKDLEQAPQKWPELKPLCMYHRFNRMSPGTLQPGSAACDVQLLDLNSQPKSLMAGCHRELLVVLAGSLTCPPFRSFLPMLKELAVMWRERVDFRLVYITEAHPKDEWFLYSGWSCPTGKPVTCNQQRTPEERVQVAKELEDMFGLSSSGIETLASPPGSDFEPAYCPWPFRAYIIRPPSEPGQPGTLLHIAKLFDVGGCINEVRSFLESSLSPK